MTFAAPWMLWSLAAIVPLVAIYMLKVRPRRRPVTALFLWQQVLQERRSHHLFHRLRDLWSLSLMALAFAAVAFALAQPRWSGEKHQDLLLLIDTSASMQAREGNATRLALAQERVRDIARAMDGVQRVAVATVDRELRYPEPGFDVTWAASPDRNRLDHGPRHSLRYRPAPASHAGESAGRPHAGHLHRQ